MIIIESFFLLVLMQKKRMMLRDTHCLTFELDLQFLFDH